MKQLLMDSAAMLVVLWVCHLIGDWILQNDWMAMRKTKDAWVRAIHVGFYSVPFVALFGALGFKGWDAVAWYVWLAGTHFVIDSYKPLMWFRRLGGDSSAGSPEKFREAFNTPRGFFVYVTYDQIFHLLTLLPLAWRLAQ